MDPEKVLADVAKALGLDEGASREELVKALDAIAALKEALAGEAEDAPAEDAPADAPPAEASREGEDTVEATADAGGAVEASDEVVEAADALPEEDAGDPAAGELRAVLDGLMEATGLDEASVLAALREKQDEVAAVIAGAPADGMPAEEDAAAAASGMSRKLKAKDVALSAAQERVKALEAKIGAKDSELAKLAKRIGEVEAEGDERRVADAIKAGHLLPASRAVFIALARADREEFLKQLKAAEGSPEVPTGRKTHPTPPAVDSVTSDIDGKDPNRVQLTKTLKAAGWSAKKIDAYFAGQDVNDFEGRA